MGNSVQNQEKDKLSQLEILKVQKIEGYGENKIYREPFTKDQFLLFTSEFNIQNCQQSEIEIMQLQELNQVKNAVQLYSYKVDQSGLMCFSKNQISLFFEHYPNSLQNFDQEINEREIWMIIADVLEFLYDLQQKGYYHGDLKPERIYLNEQKQATVYFPLIYTPFTNGYNLIMHDTKFQTTLSPEEIYFYNFRVNNPKINRQKSDIFSLGITLLSFLTKKDFCIFYDFAIPEIKFDVIKRQLNYIKRMYSKNLYEFIKMLIIESDTKRPSYQDIRQWFKEENYNNQL